MLSVPFQVTNDSPEVHGWGTLGSDGTLRLRMQVGQRGICPAGWVGGWEAWLRGSGFLSRRCASLRS